MRQIKATSEMMTAAEFKTAVLSEKRREFHGVAINGEVNLYKAEIDDYLTLDECIVFGTVNLNEASASNFVLADTIVKGSLAMNGFTSEQVDLEKSEIYGDLTLNGVAAFINLLDTKVFEDLWLEKIEKASVFLANTRVKGNIWCGKNLALAIQCLFAFGSRVILENDICAEVAALLNKPNS